MPVATILLLVFFLFCVLLFWTAAVAYAGYRVGYAQAYKQQRAWQDRFPTPHGEV